MDPQQGELWWVELDPAFGVETQGRHLCLILSRNLLGSPLRLVAPILKIKDFHRRFPQYFVSIPPDTNNRLDQTRTPELFQIRGVDFSRFVHRAAHGQIDKATFEVIRDALSLII
jgi:mRNA-degrading endonuclease toxin of MazEF toxin-antitoxin module